MAQIQQGNLQPGQLQAALQQQIQQQSPQQVLAQQQIQQHAPQPQQQPPQQQQQAPSPALQQQQMLLNVSQQEPVYQQIRMLIEDCLRHYMTQQDTINYLTSKNPVLDRKIIEMRT